MGGQYQIVYDFLSFTFACMAASTIFFWLRLGSIHERYKSALVITGLVTFIAAYHYLRIFNSWVDAYDYPAPGNSSVEGQKMVLDPVQTGTPFNDAYRYMDWLLTVPLLLIEIVFVMNLTPSETVFKATTLGIASGLMIIIGYPGEMIGPTDADISMRWIFWALALVPFIYVVYQLTIGTAAALNTETDETIKAAINRARIFTIISWLTYPIVYIIPEFGVSGATSVVGIQLGYTVSDIISKCGVGLLIYKVTYEKSKSYKVVDDA